MTSLVKCAKERHELGDTDREELTGEPYELILDASVPSKSKRTA
jgi:hypothetical protein